MLEIAFNVLDWRKRQAPSSTIMEIEPADFPKGINANLVLSAGAGIFFFK